MYEFVYDLRPLSDCPSFSPRKHCSAQRFYVFLANVFDFLDVFLADVLEDFFADVWDIFIAVVLGVFHAKVLYFFFPTFDMFS